MNVGTCYLCSKHLCVVCEGAEMLLCACVYLCSYLATVCSKERIVRYLLKKGADPLVEDLEGRLPMDVSESEVILQVLTTVTEDVTRKKEIERRLQHDAQIGSDTASSLADRPPDTPSDKKAASHHGDNGSDLSPEGDTNLDFSCHIKPRAYSYSL